MGENAFATLGAAVQKAAANKAITRIEVRSGSYAERVTIKTSGLQIIGVGPTRPTISGILNGVVRKSAIFLVEANNIRIENLEIVDGIYGVDVYCENQTWHDIHIIDNVIHGMKDTNSEQGVGIVAWGACKKIFILNNKVYDNERQGIFLGYKDNSKTTESCTISGNTVYNNGKKVPNTSPHGIELGFVNNVTVSNNEVYGHKNQQLSSVKRQGLFLKGDKITVSNNQIHDNDIGVGFYKGSKLSFQENTVFKNGKGIYFESASDPIIRQNTFSENDIGIKAPSWSGAFDATSNAFCKNTSFAVSNGMGDSINATKSWWGSVNGPNSTIPGDTESQETEGDVLVRPVGMKRPPTGPCALFP